MTRADTWRRAALLLFATIVSCAELDRSTAPLVAKAGSANVVGSSFFGAWSYDLTYTNDPFQLTTHMLVGHTYPNSSEHRLLYGEVADSFLLGYAAGYQGHLYIVGDEP